MISCHFNPTGTGGRYRISQPWPLSVSIDTLIHDPQWLPLPLLLPSLASGYIRFSYLIFMPCSAKSNSLTRSWLVMPLWSHSRISCLTCPSSFRAATGLSKVYQINEKWMLTAILVLVNIHWIVIWRVQGGVLINIQHGMVLRDVQDSRE